jgi:hypothetical protein
MGACSRRLLVGEWAGLAEKRVALVLGNSAYRNVAPLANPINDSAKIASTLKEAGFDVVDSRRDLPAAETRRALRDFADRARDADIAVVYYAGHGIEVDGANYLIPSMRGWNAIPTSMTRPLARPHPDRDRTGQEAAARDSRRLPRQSVFPDHEAHRPRSRAIGQGPCQGRTDQPERPDRLFGQGRLDRPPMVTATTARSRQRCRTISPSPGWTCAGPSALSATRCSRPRATSRNPLCMVHSAAKTCRWCRPRRPRRPAPAAPAVSAQAEARRDYELALQIGNKSALNAFLAQYPDGFYASLAKLQLDKIAAEEARVAATEKARLTEQERARLAAEGAQKSQQAKAEAEAKAAEQARVAAEKAKQVAQDQAAAAEQKRVAAESAAADKASAAGPG